MSFFLCLLRFTASDYPFGIIKFFLHFHLPNKILVQCTSSSIYYGGRYKLVLQYRILTSFWSNMFPNADTFIYISSQYLYLLLKASDTNFSLWFDPLLTIIWEIFLFRDDTKISLVPSWKILPCTSRFPPQKQSAYRHVHYFGNTLVFGLLLEIPQEKWASTFLTKAVVVIFWRRNV